MSSSSAVMCASDQDLQRRVVLFVQQPHLTLGAQLTVDASGGVVTLSGTVTSLQQRDLLHRFARHVAGVVRLVDELAVIPPIDDHALVNRPNSQIASPNVDSRSFVVPNIT